MRTGSEPSQPSPAELHTALEEPRQQHPAASLLQREKQAQKPVDIAVYYDAQMEEHISPPESGIPEKPQRINAVRDAVVNDPVLPGKIGTDANGNVAFRSAPGASVEDVDRAHGVGYSQVLTTRYENLQAEAAREKKPGKVRSLRARAEQFREQLAKGLPVSDPDEKLGPNISWSKGTGAPAALKAAGCVVEMIRTVRQGRARSGFAIVRPPGHHAGAYLMQFGLYGMTGYCYINSAVVAALVVAVKDGAKRVTLFDWDLHHGDGSQKILEREEVKAFLKSMGARIQFISIHRYGIYPWTGEAEDAGVDCINIPFMANDATNADYLAAKKFVVLPFIRAFKPELIIVSAGFDAAAGEVEFRTMLLTPEGFAEMTALLMEIAPVAMALEGGYECSSAAACAVATMRALVGEFDRAAAAAVLGGPLLPGTLTMLHRVLTVHLEFTPEVAKQQLALLEAAMPPERLQAAKAAGAMAAAVKELKAVVAMAEVGSDKGRATAAKAALKQAQAAAAAAAAVADLESDKKAAKKRPAGNIPEAGRRTRGKRSPPQLEPQGAAPGAAPALDGEPAGPVIVPATQASVPEATPRGEANAAEAVPPAGAAAPAPSPAGQSQPALFPPAAPQAPSQPPQHEQDELQHDGLEIGERDEEALLFLHRLHNEIVYIDDPAEVLERAEGTEPFVILLKTQHRVYDYFLHALLAVLRGGVGCMETAAFWLALTPEVVAAWAEAEAEAEAKANAVSLVSPEVSRGFTSCYKVLKSRFCCKSLYAEGMGCLAGTAEALRREILGEDDGGLAKVQHFAAKFTDKSGRLLLPPSRRKTIDGKPIVIPHVIYPEDAKLDERLARMYVALLEGDTVVQADWPAHAAEAALSGPIRAAAPGEGVVAAGAADGSPASAVLFEEIVELLNTKAAAHRRRQDLAIHAEPPAAAAPRSSSLLLGGGGLLGASVAVVLALLLARSQQQESCVPRSSSSPRYIGVAKGAAMGSTS